MGIPRFYRWLSERYPLINENITQEQIPEFDNLYLDMNGIIHNCSHNNTGGLCVKEENDVFVDAFNYICRLFQIIRPKKLLYMAVDGCAPRAKMNQQRSRRFRAANDAREAREKAKEMGEDVSSTQFDSNCITPGTEFMAKLTAHLRYFICKKIQEDPRWQQVTVVLSGPDTPGEGEHKIMDYIRASKAQPDYDANTRHCLYGLDADLIMLALASHELHFALLREEVVFGRRETKTTEQRMLISKDRFQLLHVALLREYMDLEFAASASAGAYPYNLERVIDDFILFCILVGNDFLPSLPFAEIGESGLEHFFSVYKDHLRSATTEPWLTCGCGQINFKQLARFLRKYAELEDGLLTAACDGGEWVLGKQRLVGPSDAPTPPEYAPDLPIEPPPTSELARVQWYDVKFGMDVDTHAGTQTQRKLLQSYLEGLHWVMRYYFRGPDEASWSWYYPYYHAPMAYDLAHYEKLQQPGIELEVGTPFRPFQQLMAVLPSSSKSLLPACFQWLFESKDSPILNFYPQKFVVDMDGVKVPWGGMTLIPFIDPGSLLTAMDASLEPCLSKAEEHRNEFRSACTLRYDMKSQYSLASTWPGKYADLSKCPVRIAEFKHPPLPAGVEHFPNYVLPGARSQDFGFPTLHRHPLTSSFEAGVKVFQFEARGQSLILHLRPDAAFQPPAQVLWQMLQAPSAIIDYPCIHRGKIIAVHTPYKKYLANGKTFDNNPLEHEKKVWLLLQEWRQRGLTVAFKGTAKDGDDGDETSGPALWRGREGDLSENELCQQPLVEVRVMESSYMDSDGRLHFKWQAGSAFRLLHLVRPEAAVSKAKTKKLSERFRVGASVLCTDPNFEVFGEMGKVSSTSDDEDGIKALFASHLPRGEQATLQARVGEVLQAQQAELKWHELPQLSRLVELEVNVVQQIVGSVFARCADYVREDLGMNLMADDKGSPACLPCYSCKLSKGWIFSDLAVEALRDYKDKFPGLFEALKGRRATNSRQLKDLEQRAIFPNRVDKDYCSRQLVKYCNACDWKKLKLAPTQYMAMTTQSVAEVARSVDDARKRRLEQGVTVAGARALCRTEESFQLPSSLFLAANEDLAVGQRGVYVNPNGAVPWGVQGTVIGIYGIGDAQQIEVLLDEECFGANDLHGRTPRLRGLQATATSFLPLFPRLSSASVDEHATRSVEAFKPEPRGAGTGRPRAMESKVAEPAADADASRVLLSLLQPAEGLPASASSSSAGQAVRSKNKLHGDMSGPAGGDVTALFAALTSSGPQGKQPKAAPAETSRAEPKAAPQPVAAHPTKIMVNAKRNAGEVRATESAGTLKSQNKIPVAASEPKPEGPPRGKKEIPDDLWRKAFNNLLSGGSGPKVQPAPRRN